jgi:hypothetical protein
MVDIVRPQLRDRPVDAKIEEIVELLNREHSPVITELRTRFNELLTLFNPTAAPVVSAGAVVAYLPVTIGIHQYVIELREPS